MQAPDGSTALELRSYGVSFGTRVILASIDLALPATGIDVLMGPVKTGKSTLARTLAGLNDNNPLMRCWGQARLCGQPLGEGRRPLLVQAHASVLNSAISDAVLHHIRSQTRWLHARRNAFVQETLQQHGLEMLAQQDDQAMLALPAEQQRAVNILSHALLAPPLLIVDEPTYGLDEAAANWLVRWLAALGQQQRMIVILHNQLQARQLADRIILLGGGRILAHARTADFFRGGINAWVNHFIRTGSLSIASPDASADMLDAGTEPPPPLPPEALAATKSFAAAAQPPTDIPVSTNAPVSQKTPAHVHTAKVKIPAASPIPSASARNTALPALSQRGVEDSAMVGLANFRDRRGPEGFNWIVPGKLAGCAAPGITGKLDYDLTLLTDIGINVLITLTEKDLAQDALRKHGLYNLHLPIYDREPPSIRQAYMMAHRIQALLDAGKSVAVHCKAGIGRTGTILAAWMIREGGLESGTAIERLRSIHPAYVQTQPQEQFLHDFEQDILTRLG